jgi:coenzyme F420-0:L-glutamate ligase/coenzyme F420-1:gamma-L-glutamate ligase
MNEITIIPIKNFPEITEGDDLIELLINCLENSTISIEENDIIVITQKIVSKSESRLRNLEDVTFEELLAAESTEIIRKRGDLVIARTKHGFICANAGIDKSNIENGHALLLPIDPDKSASKYREQIYARLQKKVAVIISDTFGRPWRVGQVNFAIGSSGIEPLVSYIGSTDTFENELNATEIAIIDEIASSAELVMEKTLNIPIAILRGVNYRDSNNNAKDLIRKKDEDFFL